MYVFFFVAISASSSLAEEFWKRAHGKVDGILINLTVPFEKEPEFDFEVDKFFVFSLGVWLSLILLALLSRLLSRLSEVSVFSMTKE